MSLLECAGLTKSFSGIRVLSDVSYSLDSGEVLGLAGENGAGKSTLMNLLGGVFAADSGRMIFDGGPYRPRTPRDGIEAGIAFIHQELNLFPNLTVAENFLAGSRTPSRFGFPDRRLARRRAAEALAALGVPVSPDTPVERLPQGEQQLVEIAKALDAQARLVILDEPTTSLTARETARLFDALARLRASGVAMIYISHTIEDVLRLSDRVLVLRGGQAVASGLTRDFTLDRLIPLMVGRALGELYPQREAARAETALEVRELSEPGLLDRISFRLMRGEVLGVAGLMGAGRSEMARILFGLERASSGEITLNGERVDRLTTAERIQRGMAFLTESRREDGLLMNASTRENLSISALRSLSRFGFVRRGQAVARTTEAARTVELHVRDSGVAVKTLSGGNQQKVALGKWLVVRPSVLILDEPTRGVDVGARHEIYRTIARVAATGTAVLLISSEIEELAGMSHRILVMSRGAITGSFEQSPFDHERLLAAAFGQGAGANL